MANKFQNNTEVLVSRHIELLGLLYDYEKPWGEKKPDFTIYSDKSKTAVAAVTDAKELEWDPTAKTILRAGKILTRSGDPHSKVRSIITSNRAQFKHASDYPCIFYIGSSGPILPAPIFVIAAMLGDLTLSIPTGLDATTRQITQHFGRSALMVEPGTGTPRNTTITAIGLVSAIRPEEYLSGFTHAVSEFAKDLDTTDDKSVQRYISRCQEFTQQAIGRGFDLELCEPEVTYVLNPFSKIKFPDNFFKKRYSNIYEYEMNTQTFDETWTWRPSLGSVNRISKKGY